MWKPFTTHDQGQVDEMMPLPGWSIDYAINRAVYQMNQTGRALVLNFNGIHLLIDTDDEEVLLARFWAEFES